MSIDYEYDVLSRLELFEHLQPAKLKRLTFVSKRYDLHPDELLFKQGDPMDSVFGIVQGELSAVLESGGKEFVVAKQSPGDLVGEMAVISGEPRSASIRANTSARLLALKRSYLSIR